MGFPLRSNIFRAGTGEQNYFQKFPIQVAVLYSPRDSVFGNAFRELFAKLDKLTGDQVAFFAVLDPPQDWRDIAATRTWWQKYQQEIGQSGFSFDDRTLVKEIARLFGVAWDEFPVLIVSNNLWSSECVICPTSQWHIEPQLLLLTNLVKRWEQPNIHHIISSLQDLHGNAVRYSAGNSNALMQISTFYRFLDTFQRDYQKFNENGYNRLLDQTIRRIRGIFNTTRANTYLQRNHLPEPDINSSQDYSPANEVVMEDIVGQLIAPATVADQASQYFSEIRNKRRTSDSPIHEELEDESIAMIDGAIRIGNLMENELIGRPPQLQLTDFTPAAAGIWKAVEREMNFSVIQAVRSSRTIRMPDFFTQFDPTTVDENLILVKTPRKININQQDKKHQHSGRHVFLELGKGYHVTTCLLAPPNPVLQNIICGCLGSPFPLSYLESWQVLSDIRNKGSHTETLSISEYEAVLKIFMGGLLEAFVKIKKKMRG